MNIRTAVARWDGAGLSFRATSGSGHELVLDDVHGDTGPRPVELLVLGLAGCTGMDAISILQKKRQEVTRYAVTVTAEQRGEPHPAVFTRADVLHEVDGPAIDEAAVRRAIELSATRYCSVGAMLSAGTVEIRHRYRIVSGNRTEPIEGEVAVLGPHADPDRAEAARAQQPIGG